jgi:hypothetical protein
MEDGKKPKVMLRLYEAMESLIEISYRKQNGYC